MSCKIEFTVHSNEGASNVITLEVPNASEMTLEEAIGALMGNADSYRDFITAVNGGGFPITNLDTKAMLSQGLPLGNYNLNTIRNEFGTPNINYLVTRLQEEGVNLNERNILLTNAKFSLNWNSNYGLFKLNGQSLAVIKPKEDYIESYLKQLYINTMLDKAPSNQVGLIHTYAEMALRDLMNYPDLSKRVEATIKKIGFNAETGKLEGNKAQAVSDFVNYFYTSALFNDALYKNGSVGTFNRLFNEMIGTPPAKVLSYADPTVQALIDRSEISGNYVRIPADAIKDFMEKYSYGEVTPENIVAAIQDLNSKIENEQFLDIAFISDNGVLLRNTRKEPVFDKTVVNTEYGGDLVEQIETYNGYNISKYDGKYYVDSRLVTTADGLKGNGFNDLKHAQNVVKTLLDRKIDLKSATSKLKSNREGAIALKQTLEVGDKFTVLDIELDSKIDLFNDKELVKSITFNNFMSELNKKPQYKKIISILKEDGINIESILNTPEKLETFFLLKNQLRDKERHVELYGNKTPSMLTADKIEFETNLITETLNRIENATESVYEVTGAVDGKYTFTKLPMEKSIPVHKKVPRSFKSEMVEVADHLGRNYGIKINVVTARELADDFKGVIPYAGRTNAFIYNGEIYLNVDRATTADSLHEFAHLMMGSLKRTNPELYYGLVEQVEQLANYDDKVQAYRNLGDMRAVPDLNEEIFVTEFGNYFAKITNAWFEGKEADLNELGNLFKEKTQKTFQTTDDIKGEKLGKLLNMSIDEIMSEFGSALIGNDLAAGFDMNLATESRTITNLIQKLIKSGHLKEDC